MPKQPLILTILDGWGVADLAVGASVGQIKTGSASRSRARYAGRKAFKR